MCYFHMLRNIEKYESPSWEHLCSPEKWYNHTTSLPRWRDVSDSLGFAFFFKWTATSDRQVTDFLEYFRAHWVAKNNAWLEGAALGHPSSNNGIEAINAVIKRKHTFRERLPIGHFMHSGIELVEKWSPTRNPDSENCIKYALSRLPSLKDWITAYQWATANKNVVQCDDDEQTYYTSSTTSKKDINIPWIRRMKKKEGTWKTFEEFNEYRNGVRIIHIDDRNLGKSSCTCPFFLKEFTCKHILGMLIRLQLRVSVARSMTRWRNTREKNTKS